MKIRTRLLCAVALAMVVPVVMLIESLSIQSSSQSSADKVREDLMVRMQMLARVDMMMKNSRGHIVAGFAHDPSRPDIAAMHQHPMDAHTKLLAGSQEELGTLVSKLRQMLPSEGKERTLIDTVETGVNAYRAQTLEVARKALETGAFPEAIKATTVTFKTFAATEAAIGELVTLTKQEVDALGAKMKSDGRNGAILSIVIALAGMIGIGLMMGLAYRAVMKSVASVRNSAERLQAGKLGASGEQHPVDELGEVCRILDGSIATLGETIRSIRGASAEISTASAEISLGNDNLAQRTMEQSGSVEHTSSMIRGLAETVSHHAATAAEADTQANNASNSAEQGGEIVGRVVEAMRSIKGSSQRIAEIVSVIDGIAFQTNILALNASVEAARAGELGRGFAVVAGEVRTLATRSSTAAQEIRRLIADTVARIDHGTENADLAGNAIREIVGSAKQVAQMVAELNNASTAQSANIQQLAGTLSTIDEMTQQNAALVEETAAASDSLKNQTVLMRESLERFSV